MGGGLALGGGGGSFALALALGLGLALGLALVAFGGGETLPLYSRIARLFWGALRGGLGAFPWYMVEDPILLYPRTL